jgi:TetR/AcrR family transcriptional repressor of nem operon
MDEPPPRRQPPDVRREQILDAAQRVLLERGLRATTVADVVDAAGVAKGTMYLYFRSKDELLTGLRARYLDDYAHALNARSDAPVRERIRRLVVGLFDFGSKHHALHHVLFHEAGVSEHDAFTAVRDALVALIEEGVAAGELAILDVGLASSFVLNGVHGALVEVLHGGQHRRRSAIEVGDLVDRALSA